MDTQRILASIRADLGRRLVNRVLGPEQQQIDRRRAARAARLLRDALARRTR